MFESPKFVKVSHDSDKVRVWNDPETENVMTGAQIPPIMEFELLNFVNVCESFMPCNVQDFKAKMDSNPTFDKMDILESELEKIKEVMREDKALDYCTILQFKLQNGPEDVAFCVTDEVLFDPFRKTIGKAFDHACAAADVNTVVAAASKEDVFDVIYDGQETKIQFGEEAVQDAANNGKVFAYIDMGADKFGTQCAIWRQGIEVPAGHHESCCFMMLI